MTFHKDSDRCKEEFIKTGMWPNEVMYQIWRKAWCAALAGQAPKALSDDDVHCLIGHAEYLKIVKGQQDMPAYFYQLAERIALSIGDKPLADRVKELAAKNGLTLSAEPANKEQKREPIRRTGQANPRCN
jgi:hypothetical protein